jgi:phage tail-like protein
LIMANYYPPAGFHFTVSLDYGVTDDENDARFQSVSGLNVEFETETIREGGENRFEHKIPVRSKYPNLILKRGMVTDSKLIAWCMDAFENLIIVPSDILISLLNEEHEPLKSWKIKHAWPLKWDVGDFNAEESKLVIETLELTYQYFTVE